MFRFLWFVIQGLFIYSVIIALVSPLGNGFAGDFGYYLGSSARFLVTLGGLISF